MYIYFSITVSNNSIGVNYLFVSGGYETGHAEYKHFYFNCNRNTAVIWTFTVIALIGLYEGIKTIFTSVYQGNKHIVQCREKYFYRVQ